jgi:diguanylate cyclase (GGDEF)-like protein
MTAGEKIREKLKSLRESYVRQLPDRVTGLEEFYERFKREPAAFAGLPDFHRLAHSLKGSSATFGYKEMGDAAFRLERLLKALLQAGGKPDAHHLEEVGVSLGFVRDALSRLEEKDDGAHLSFGAALAAGLVESTEKRLVYLVEDDPHVLQDLSLQISCFGYEVGAFAGLAGLVRAVKEKPPAAIIADIVFPEGELAGVEAVSGLLKELAVPLPVIFISARNDLSARLMAVRAGGNAYFVKPVNITDLIDKLDVLTRDQEEARYKALIIDDDPDQAAYHSLILQEAGMSTEVVNDPMLVYAPLVEFNPDILLMDMYMPGCNGMELSRTIRQMPAFFSLPIVFLSGETDQDKQFKAMSMGGDDFLTKPIKPEHLISSVSVRAERMRIIRSFMQCDSLTGLLNHTKTKELLDGELIKAARRNGNLAFAMIDLDLFKSINDTHGHSTGDQVIISLSRLLKQRLRKTDIIGRYGGEEFAVILLDTDAAFALSIMDGIRDSFAKIRHLAAQGEFSSSFSCGIATFPCCKSPAEISKVADLALYSAKHQGRNRVVMADGEKVVAPLIG